MRLELIDDVLMWLTGEDLAKTRGTSLKTAHEIDRRLAMVRKDADEFEAKFAVLGDGGMPTGFAFDYTWVEGKSTVRSAYLYGRGMNGAIGPLVGGAKAIELCEKHRRLKSRDADMYDQVFTCMLSKRKWCRQM